MKLGFWRGAQVTAIAGIAVVLLKGGGPEMDLADKILAGFAFALWPSLVIVPIADSAGLEVGFWFFGLILLNILWWGGLAYITWPFVRAKGLDGNTN